MKVIDLPLDQLREAEWNPNSMSDELLAKLRESIVRFGVVENLVVRRIQGGYEVVNGNQRLRVYRDLGLSSAPCVVLDLDDASARLLAHALNRLQGEDALGLRAELIRDVLKSIPQEEVLAVLPETASSLEALASLGQETIVEHLKAWEEAQKARLHHLSFHLTEAQLEVVEEALSWVLPLAKMARTESPNLRGTALYVLCQRFLEVTCVGGYTKGNGDAGG